MKVQYGLFDNVASVHVEIYSNTEMVSGTIQISDSKGNETSFREKTKVIGYVIFHGVKITVLGLKLYFDIHIQNNDQFNNYTAMVCNTMGCNNMTLELREASKYLEINIFKINL